MGLCGLVVLWMVDYADFFVAAGVFVCYEAQTNSLCYEEAQHRTVMLQRGCLNRGLHGLRGLTQILRVFCFDVLFLVLGWLIFCQDWKDTT